MIAFKQLSYRKMFADALNPYKIVAALLPIFGHTVYSEERAKQIAELIKEDLLKTKDTIDIQDVMEAYSVNAWVAHKALKLLEKEGVIVEVD